MVWVFFPENGKGVRDLKTGQKELGERIVRDKARVRRRRRVGVFSSWGGTKFAWKRERQRRKQ